MSHSGSEAERIRRRVLKILPPAGGWSMTEIKATLKKESKSVNTTVARMHLNGEVTKTVRNGIDYYCIPADSQKMFGQLWNSNFRWAS